MSSCARAYLGSGLLATITTWWSCLVLCVRYPVVVVLGLSVNPQAHTRHKTRNSRRWLSDPPYPLSDTVRFRGMGTSISEASKRVPIFSFATQGGKQESSHFRQGNWDKTSRLRPGRLEHNCLGMIVPYEICQYELASQGRQNTLERPPGPK